MFVTLARAIVFQQLAGRAASVIHGRFVEAIGGKVTPAAVLATPFDDLRGAGLSTAKANFADRPRRRARRRAHQASQADVA